MSQTPSKYRAVFISPHLDDAVFSCGGTIARLNGEGPVLVLNVFTRYPGELERGPVVIRQSRHQEETAAANSLGFRSETLDWVDAALRRREYRHPARLFDTPVEADISEVASLARSIQERLSVLEYDAVYVPLGIGWHVDHVLCHSAACSLSPERKVIFYEDAPYCLIPNASTYRMRELGAEPDLPDGEDRSFLSEWYETCSYYAAMAPIQRLGAWPVRTVGAVVVSAYFWKLLSGHRRARHSDRRRIALRPTLSNVTGELAAKIDACYCYSSQMPEFFLDRIDCEARYRRYSAIIGKTQSKVDPPGSVYERFWQPE